MLRQLMKKPRGYPLTMSWDASLGDAEREVQASYTSIREGIPQCLNDISLHRIGKEKMGEQ